MARKITPKEQTLTVPVTVLGIDSNYEPATLAAYNYREQQVYPYIAGKGYALDKCQGPLARLIPNSTLSVRHDPITKGAKGVFFSTPS